LNRESNSVSLFVFTRKLHLKRSKEWVRSWVQFCRANLPNIGGTSRTLAHFVSRISVGCRRHHRALDRSKLETAT